MAAMLVNRHVSKIAPRREITNQPGTRTSRNVGLARRLAEPQRLTEPQIECLPSFFSGTNLELNFSAFAQILKINFGRKARAMEKYLFAAVIGDDKAKAFVFHDLLYCTEHEHLPAQSNLRND